MAVAVARLGLTWGPMLLAFDETGTWPPVPLLSGAELSRPTLVAAQEQKRALRACEAPRLALRATCRSPDRRARTENERASGDLAMPRIVVDVSDEWSE
jgi:hypothetical protein